MEFEYNQRVNCLFSHNKIKIYKIKLIKKILDLNQIKVKY